MNTIVELFNCEKCKIILKILIKEYIHKCMMCKKIYCKKCDDMTEDLMWRDSNSLDISDKYLCEKCHVVSSK
jgi:predicted RNA-binding Zn-ribbon protein involved in translation (DUF1610 family)